jgi:ADP-heptose:LPS heptosyltransferase
VPKFLVLRFSSIGDIVLTTPVIRCLKTQVKDAEVHFCTKRTYAGVIAGNPYIDRAHFLGDDLTELLESLRRERYDAVIDLHHNLRSLRVKRALGTRSTAFPKTNFEKWLMVNFRIDRLPRVHVVDRYFEAAKPLGVMDDGKGLDFFLAPEDEQVVEQLPESFRGGYVALVIGARHFTKQLPAEKLAAVCLKLERPVVFLGGPEDRERGETILAAVGQEGRSPHRVNGCGTYSLKQSAALVKHARVVITHDTGLMHIAAAFQKNIVSVWGNTIPAFGMTPYFGSAGTGQNTILEVDGLSCRPCSKIGYDKCPKGHFRCMNDIPADKVVDAVKNYLF